jgi:hypothetical protein
MYQHYVPKVYLKNFGEKKNKKYFVDVFNKGKNYYFNAPTTDICADVNLYTLDVGTTAAKDVLAVEKVYANHFEPLYGKCYEILIDPTKFYVTDLERVEIIVALMQFYPRNPALIERAKSIHRNQITHLYRQETSKGAKGMTYLDEDFSFRDFSLKNIIDHFDARIIRDFKEKHLAALSDLGAFHEFVKIEVHHIKDETEFITSDNPLVFIDHLHDDGQNPLRRSNEFSITLNKKTAVSLFHDNSKQLNQIYRAFLPNGSVYSINKHVYDQSSRFVIGSKKGIEELFRIEELMREIDSLEKRIDIIRQIIKKVPETKEFKPSLDRLRYYVTKYDAQGSLNEDDEQRLYTEIRNEKMEMIRRRMK